MRIPQTSSHLSGTRESRRQTCQRPGGQFARHNRALRAVEIALQGRVVPQHLLHLNELAKVRRPAGPLLLQSEELEGDGWEVGDRTGLCRWT